MTDFFFIEKLIDFLPTLMTISFFSIVAIIVHKIINRFIARLGKQQHCNAQLIKLLQTVSKYIIFALYTALILENLHIQIGPIIATFGITSIGIGFALKDIISNIMAGILILFYQPFTINDEISTKSYQGKVVNIDLRFTTLENKSELILIPNTVIYSNIVSIKKESSS